jgi:hypothetical protein
MFEMTIRYILQGVILAAGLCVAGAATAQESGSTSAAPEEIQQAGGEMAPVAVGSEDAGGISTTKGNVPGTAISPAPRMTWDAAAPELDPFGNETVPIFNSAYSER